MYEGSWSNLSCGGQKKRLFWKYISSCWKEERQLCH